MRSGAIEDLMEAKKHRRRKSESSLRSKPLHGENKTSTPAPSVAHAPAEEAGTPEENPSLSVVGVGASAGGLEAFTKLLRALPVDTGMAFVFVQHLSPTRESALAEILSRATSMSVTEVVAEPALEPNRVYVIPPDRNMVIARGHLRLLPREARGVQHPIDQFFRSLAENQRHMAIGVVLSGTATDGTLGLEEIKAEGGFTFAQDETAQQQGMPQSAVASGCVDFVLPPQAIAAEIARIATQPYIAARPDGHETKEAKRDAAQAKESLAPILHLLRSATGVDFTQYKANTLLRRIGRRMVLQQKEGLEEYTRHIRESSTEVEALYKDILINVTSFFRDLEMFEALKGKVLPALLRERSPNDPLRVWVLACSTGEEVYSLAMILSEAMESTNSPASAQIFATDLNDSAIERARAGVYSKERLQDVSRERLRRFFTELDGDLRITKRIRDMCLFSRHNVMADPPFSRMDIVSCRNLLIYLDPSLQQRIIPVLHYALKPTGFLILGASETVGRFTDLFGAEDSKHKIFRKKPGSGRLPLLPVSSTWRSTPSDAVEMAARPPGPATGAARIGAFGCTDVHKEADRLLASFAPPAVLVDGNLEILQFRGNTEPYLVPAQGRASHALLKMAREDLLVPLQALLHRAKKENAPAGEEGLRVRSSGGYLEVNLQVLPVKGNTAQEGGFLVLFKDASAADEPRAKVAKGTRTPKTDLGNVLQDSSAANIARLEHELASTREYLQALTEQYEATNEELQSSSEEAQSANEELQSINEELETSKEEIQSSNEELTTINDELSNRNQELVQLSGDLTNLISSVQVAIVIVARDHRIRRFSPMAEEILSVIPSDVGRPLTDIRLNITFPELDSLLTEAIDTSSAKEREVQTVDGRWYSLRIRPYLTDGNKVDGAVLSMIDINAIRRAREYAESIVATVRNPLLVLDDQFRVRSANPSFYNTFGVTRDETEGRLLYELGGGEWDIQELRVLLGEVLPRESIVNDFAMEHAFKGCGHRAMLLNARTLLDPFEARQSILLSFEDVTERKRLEEDQGKRNEVYVATDIAKNHFLAVLSHELRSPLNIIRLWSQILQRPGRSDDNLRKGLEVIDRSSKAQARLVEDLLDVHRISSGKLRLELAEVDLVEIIRLVVDSMAPAATEKEIRIDREIDPAPALMSGDPARLQQVLGNLLGNAIKFTPKGGKVRIALRRKETRAEVKVSDTGEGISAAGLSHVFEGFRQADPLTSHTHGGLGLGLAIANQLVELHGGTITAESPGKGGGAAFTVSLPLLSGKGTTRRPPVSVRRATEERPSSLGGVLVLVVDDEPDAREALRWVLEEAGSETTVVGSTEEALDALQRQQPDVILSDIGMPGRDGYDLMRSVRALPPGRGGQVPAIALTAYAASEDRDRALSAGFQTHLAKPVEAANLIAAIAALVSQTPPGSAGRGGAKEWEVGSGPDPRRKPPRA